MGSTPGRLLNDGQEGAGLGSALPRRLKFATLKGSQRIDRPKTQAG